MSQHKTVIIQHPEDKIVESAVFEMIERSKAGLIKYGKSMAQANMGVRQALIEARQEAMDQVIYLSKAIYEYELTHPHKAPGQAKGTSTLIACKCAFCLRK